MTDKQLHEYPEMVETLETAIRTCHEIYDTCGEEQDVLEESTVTVSCELSLELTEALVEALNIYEGFDPSELVGFLDAVKQYPNSIFASKTKH